MQAPALDALFAAHGSPRSCASGERLFAVGDKGDQLFRVEEGRLAVLSTGEDGCQRPLGIIGSGDIVGEMALLRESARTTTIVAISDSRLRQIGSDQLFAAAEHNPLLWRDLARIAMRRMRDPATPVGARPARTIGLVAISPSIDAAAIAHGIAGAIGRQGARCVVLPAACPAEDVAAAERVHDHVLVPVPFRRAAPGQVISSANEPTERTLLLADPAEAVASERGVRAGNLLPADLLLISGSRGSGQPEAWTNMVRPRRLFSMKHNNAADLDRIARTLRHAAVGLVLSGGGARAFAHIGAVRALCEAGVPIDTVGGTSMGALVAAAVACGWPGEEIDARMRAAFVSSSPLDDIAFPMIAMTRGCKVDQRLERHFGSRPIEGLPLPFFCVSANLTRGTPQFHRTGPLAAALRASISLPGILPPVVRDGDVLVDGGVLRNLPTDVMRQHHDGPILAVDVSRARGLTPEQVALPPSMTRWVLGGRWRCGPPIVSILMRSATLASQVEQEMARAAADFHVQPDLGSIEIRDWKAYPQAVEAGYRAMRAALEAPGALVSTLKPA